MDLKSLQERIETKQARLAVIGLGYVGLPVACQFAEAGLDVLGIDIIEERVQKINAGISPIEGDEPGLAELLARVIAANEQARTGRLHASTDYRLLRDRDVLFIDVETPVDEHNVPRYQALQAALHSLGSVLQEGALVIVESTIAPGTMNRVVLPILEETSGRKVNQGFYLGNCPERVMPGKLLQNLRTISRVVGGMTPETAQVMSSLYRLVVQADLDPADCVTAELVKTAENAYRDVQIAFANEVALICEAVGGDVWQVRELVNKSPYRQMHLPGAGVGGHCIPKDPWLLVHGVQEQDVPVRLIPAARAVNSSMPLHMMSLTRDVLNEQGIRLVGARILVMGYAYLENSDDTRNSPSEVLISALQNAGSEVTVHDPFVEGFTGSPIEAARGCDAAIVMVRHSEYQALDLAALRSALRTPVLIDGRKVFSEADAVAAGLVYQSIGVARSHE